MSYLLRKNLGFSHVGRLRHVSGGHQRPLPLCEELLRMLYSAGSNGKSNRLCGVPHRDGTDSARVLQDHHFQTRAERTSWPKSLNSVRSAWDEAQTSSRNFMTCSGLRHARTRAHRLVLGRQKASTPEYLQ